MNAQLNILIVDDHALFREGLEGLLNILPEVRTIFQASNGYEAILVAEKEDLDVILMDIEMPVMDGFQATKIIHNKYPNIKILALSMRDNPSSILEMCSHGASGYLFKICDLQEIKNGLETVLNGEKYFQKEIGKIIINGIIENANNGIPFKFKNIVKEKERIILTYLAEGMTIDQISLKMNYSVKTIEGIKTNLFIKTETRNIASLIAYCLRNRIID